MEKRYQYIKGIFKAKYTGAPIHLDKKGTKPFDRAFNIDLKDVEIKEAEEIGEYTIESIDQKSFEISTLLNASTTYKSESSDLINNPSYINVIIKNVELSNVVPHNENVYGTLSGDFYGTIDLELSPDQDIKKNKDNVDNIDNKKRLQKPQPIISSNNFLGCFTNLLSFLGLILLLLILWCFLFGNCSINKIFIPCPECPEPIIRTDTIIVIKNDTIRIIPDSTITIIEDGTTYELGTGELQVSLFWNDINDLDLVVETPNRDFLYFRTKNIGGGSMDHDKNNDRGNLSDSPVENIYWNEPPSGTYKIYVLFYNRNKLSFLSSDFKVRIKYKNEINSFEGKLNRAFKDQRGELNLRNLEFEDYAKKIFELEVR